MSGYVLFAVEQAERIQKLFFALRQDKVPAGAGGNSLLVKTIGFRKDKHRKIRLLSAQFLHQNKGVGLFRFQQNSVYFMAQHIVGNAGRVCVLIDGTAGKCDDQDLRQFSQL